MPRLFGTDGVRGKAGEIITASFALRLAQAATITLSKTTRPKVLIAMDTRLSGDMLCHATAAGVCAAGGDACILGVVPTPALPYLAKLYKAQACVMISASHNPYYDNGIKWFTGDGFKLTDQTEDKIEALLNSGELMDVTDDKVGRITYKPGAKDDYINHLVSLGCDLSGMKIALDCACGASSEIAKEVFTRLGATVFVTADKPNGLNINDSCGSTHIENLESFVLKNHADMGFAFDGDADRCLACDEQGHALSGDKIMGILALDMKKRGALSQDTLVITVMSNLGLKVKMQKEGVAIKETAVGDRYVLEEMLRGGYSIGGEASGHIILLENSTTGDGELSALTLAGVVKNSGKTLSELSAAIPEYPQYLLNVRVKPENKDAALSDQTMQERKAEVETKLGDSGRVFIRASGTEPLIRIMLEGSDQDEIKRLAHYICEPLEQYEA